MHSGTGDAISGENEVSTCLHIMCLLWDARSKPLLTVQLSLLLQLFRYTLSVFLCKWTQAWGRSSAAKSRYGFGMDMHGSMKKKQQLNCSLASCRADVPRTKDSLMWLILCWFPFVSAVPREYFWILRYLWVCPTGINTHNSYLSLQHRNWLGLSKQHLRQNPLPPPHAIWVQSPKRTQTSQSCTSLGTLW